MRRKDIKCLKTSEYHKCLVKEKENDKTRQEKTRQCISNLFQLRHCNKYLTQNNLTGFYAVAYVYKYIIRQ